MIWIQAYMICIQIIYDFKIIYDLAYDLKTCWHMICFNIIYGIICDLAQRSYKHPYMVENGPYMIWNPCPHMIWNPHMITIYGLVDIWSHIWSLNPMGWGSQKAQTIPFGNSVPYLRRTTTRWHQGALFRKGISPSGQTNQPHCSRVHHGQRHFQSLVWQLDGRTSRQKSAAIETPRNFRRSWQAGWQEDSASERPP